MKKYIALLIITMSFFTNSCKFYSLSGADVHSDLKTFSISRIINQAEIINPTLTNLLQTKLRNRLNRQTSLREVTSNGDLQYDVIITDYRVQETAVNSGSLSSENKLIISIKCTFTNSVEEKNNFETTFSTNENFSSTTTLQAAESLFLDDMSTILVDKIFNESLVNW